MLSSNRLQRAACRRKDHRDCFTYVPNERKQKRKKTNMLEKLFLIISLRFKKASKVHDRGGQTSRRVAYSMHACVNINYTLVYRHGMYNKRTAVVHAWLAYTVWGNSASLVGSDYINQWQQLAIRQNWCNEGADPIEYSPRQYKLPMEPPNKFSSSKPFRKPDAEIVKIDFNDRFKE